jgi:hypothetical protein
MLRAALRLVGGRVGVLTASLFVVGVFVLITGASPVEWATNFVQQPPTWITYWWSPYVLVLIGLAIIAGSLWLNVHHAHRRARDALSELLSEGIHEILNRRVTSQAELDELVKFEANWQERVVKILEASFTRSDVVHFTRLGSMSATSFGFAFNDAHNHLLMMYATRERRLRDIIFQHRRD